MCRSHRNNRPGRRCPAVAALLLLLWCGPAEAAPVLGAQAAVAAANRRVTMAELLSQELSTLRQLRAQRVEMRRVRMGRRSTHGELRRVYVALGEVKRRQRGLVKQIDDQRVRLRRRVRALYRLVRSTSRWPLLDSRRAHVPQDGRDTLLRIVRRDVNEVKHLQRERKRLSEELADVRKRREQGLAVLKDLDRRRDRIQAQLAQCNQELVSLRHRRSNHRGQASEWNHRARELDGKIVKLTQSLRREVGSFDERRGKLLRPVPGLIVRWFGKERIAGTKATTAFKGVEISALPNWKVRSPAPGKVRFIGPVAGFGNVVIIDHDEGYLSVLGHLDRTLVKVGDAVPAGRPIALFAQRSRQERPAVYYELRRGGASINPIPWLRGGVVEYHRRGPRRPRSERKGVAVEIHGSTHPTTAQRD
ncbi:MAG: peptidoglycan DD-metalloendopeptidase family protein [bacterium]